MILEYAIAFLIGSIPTAYWYARYFHKLDIRQHGSGNIGATNSLRVLGKKAGVIVLIIDLLKGLIPVLIAKNMDFTPESTLIVGVFAVLGHLFSPFMGFKGGKGIATAFGVILGFSPLAALLCVVAFGLVYYFTRFVSLGSLLGVLVFLIFTLIQFKDNLTVQLLAAGLTVLLFFSHRENIKRLLSGTEGKV
jgi:glycerol-3-phosphate acyltransferase PlsY